MDDIQIGTLQKLPDGSFSGALSRVYDEHSPAEVWRMLTEPACIAQWIAPGSIELKVGGAVRIDFGDSGVRIDSKVTELKPGEVLAYSWSSPGEPERLLRWSLKALPSAVQLSLSVHIPAGEDAAKACAGFEGHLQILAGALEGVPIKFPFELYKQARAAYTQQLEHL
ncbi:MAG TPA: SRPBCC domain-containing protein [Castellaniella sp.]|uniref:SRPBCC domain-containing protein n=1 Tax=Castellaniella sp. TaxID=1955812 RepID=UPI002F1764B2